MIYVSWLYKGWHVFFCFFLIRHDVCLSLWMFWLTDHLCAGEGDEGEGAGTADHYRQWKYKGA